MADAAQPYYSPEALTDLDEIFDYCADTLQNAQKGAAVVNAVLAANVKALRNPRRFPPVGPLPNCDAEYRFVREGNYLSFFRCEAGVVYVDRVLYKSRDFAALLNV